MQMEKEGKASESAKKGVQENVRGDISVLKQLVDSLDESEQKLEDSYKKNDPDSFNKAKKFMLDTIEKISEVSK